MLDLRPKLHTSKQEAAASTICPKHNHHLKVYCETCHQVICCECTFSKEHKTHDHHLISECYPKHHQQLQEGLVQIKQEMTNIDVAVSHLDDREKEVLQQGERLTEEINTHAQEMIDQIVRSRIHLSQQVDTIVQQKTHTLRAQKQQAHIIHTQLKTCQEMIEHNLIKWNQLQILAEKQEMLKEMNTVIRNVNPAVFEPTEKANIELAKNEQIQTEIGTISSTTYSKATLKVPAPCIAKKLSTATLGLQSQDGSPFPLSPSLISFTLSSPSDHEVSVKCNVTQTNPGEYNITFTLIVSRGEHLLTIQVGGVDIPNSPFTLPVIPNGEKPVMTINGLNDPVRIAVCANGDIVVAEYTGNCITIFNKNGEKIRSIKRTTLGEFNGPNEVDISNDGHILVTDNHRLQKLTTDGVCVQSIGSSNRGIGSLEFHCPRGIAVHPTTGEIFVADYGNHRVQVFNGADLSFSHTIRHGNLKEPWDIAVDSEGYLYTSDTHYVYKFTTTGQYIQRILAIRVSDQTNPFIMFKTMMFKMETIVIRLTIYHKHIYITDTYNNHVLIFDTNGKQLHLFGTKGSGEGEFNRPTGITVDTSGFVYVCDSDNNRIVVY